MSWLRLDDGAPEHRKVLALKRGDRWTWIELLAYCARQDDGGRVPSVIGEVLRYVTPSFLAECRRVGLLDVDDAGEIRVHDWAIYNGATLDERVSAVLGRYPQASANDVHRAIGGNRNAVLESVRRYRDDGSNPGTKSGICPSPSKTSSPRTSSVGPARDDDDDDLLSRLDRLEPTDVQRLRWTVALNRDPELVERQLAAALRLGTKPGAYLDSLILRGDDPGTAVEPPAPVEHPPIAPELEQAAAAELDALGPFRSREDDLRDAIGRTVNDGDD